MDRARRSAALATLLVFGISAIALASSGAPASQAASSVAWPISTGLLLAEVVTGGASASDEYVEITNGGSVDADLGGIELVYITSSGAAVTRKATWSSPRPLGPGQHLLVANVLGVYAPTADASYSGGLAATGGALALRVVGGAPIDALGWGDATNGFVEGTAAPAPAARSSIERKPGGIGGNVIDTNDNALDWLVNAAPSAQNLAAPPVPAPTATSSPSLPPSASPSPNASPDVSPSPSIAPSPDSSPTPSASPSAEPSPSPESSPSPEPSTAASASPSPEPSTTPAPSPDPSPSPSPAPSTTPSPSPSPVTIADARSLPDGTGVTVEGVLTTRLGALETEHAGFIQDGTAGIGLYLDAPMTSGLPAGTQVVVEGVLDERYGQRTLRITAGAVREVGLGILPEALSVATGSAGEALEGSRVAVAGVLTEAPSALSDGIGLTVDDGTGPVRIVVSPEAMDGQVAVRGSQVWAIGPLGQRDSSGTGLAGYRIHATLRGELTLAAPPSPSPEPSASAGASPSPMPSPTPYPSIPPGPSPSATPAPSPTPSPSPSPTPSPDGLTSIGEARLRPVGSHVRVRGVVTAEPGRIGTPALFVIQDVTAGLAVRRLDGMNVPSRGSLIEVAGVLAAPNGQLELRFSDAAALVNIGSSVLPSPLAIDGAQLAEATESRLVAIKGLLVEGPTKATSGDLGMYLIDAAGGRFRAMADSSSGLAASDFPRGRAYSLTGIVGQHASRKGALDGYRVWLRDRGDVSTAAVGAGSSPTGSQAAGAIAIARALLTSDDQVVIEGVVTVGPALLDGTGRLIVIQDSSAAVEVRLPAAAAPPALLDRLRVTGTMGRAYGAPRFTAESVVRLSRGVTASPLDIHAAPGSSHEWRLVRITGTVVDVHRLGGRWQAEVRVGGDRVPVIGLARSGIPSTAIQEGRRVTIVGIVRRPYPSATDRRFAIEPRSMADVALGPTSATAGAGSQGATGSGLADGADGSGAGTGGSVIAEAGGPLDVDIGQLGEHLGETVRIGGLVVEIVAGEITLDDGTARGRAVLRGQAAAYLSLLATGDPVNLVGSVEGEAERPVLVVTDPTGVIRVGALGELLPLAGGLASLAPANDPPDPQSATHATAGAIPDGLLAPTGAGLASLLAVTLLSVVVTVLRRRRVQRAVATRIAARLAAISGSRPASSPSIRPPRMASQTTQGLPQAPGNPAAPVEPRSI